MNLTLNRFQNGQSDVRDPAALQARALLSSTQCPEPARFLLGLFWAREKEDLLNAALPGGLWQLVLGRSSSR